MISRRSLLKAALGAVAAAVVAPLVKRRAVERSGLAVVTNLNDDGPGSFRAAVETGWAKSDWIPRLVPNGDDLFRFREHQRLIAAESRFVERYFRVENWEA